MNKKYITRTGPFSLLWWLTKRTVGSRWFRSTPRRYWHRGRYWFRGKWHEDTPWCILRAYDDIRMMIRDWDEVGLIGAFEEERKMRSETNG